MDKALPQNTTDVQNDVGHKWSRNSTIRKSLWKNQAGALVPSVEFVFKETESRVKKREF